MRFIRYLIRPKLHALVSIFIITAFFCSVLLKWAVLIFFFPSFSYSIHYLPLVITVDSLFVITGSRDMSLKVWQATGGKLAQVLVGHSDAVTCVAVSVANKTQVISGSKDCNLIVWDIHTGEEIHTLAGHLAQVSLRNIFKCTIKIEMNSFML